MYKNGPSCQKDYFLVGERSKLINAITFIHWQSGRKKDEWWILLSRKKKTSEKTSRKRYNLSWILKDECLPAGAFANPVKHGIFKDTEAWN